MSELSNEYGGLGRVCELGWVAERAAMAANDYRPAGISVEKFPLQKVTAVLGKMFRNFDEYNFGFKCTF